MISTIIISVLFSKTCQLFWPFWHWRKTTIYIYCW